MQDFEHRVLLGLFEGRELLQARVLGLGAGEGGGLERHRAGRHGLLDVLDLGRVALLRLLLGCLAARVGGLALPARRGGVGGRAALLHPVLPVGLRLGALRPRKAPAGLSLGGQGLHRDRRHDGALLGEGGGRKGGDKAGRDNAAVHTRLLGFVRAERRGSGLVQRSSPRGAGPYPPPPARRKLWHA